VTSFDSNGRLNDGTDLFGGRFNLCLILSLYHHPSKILSA
jgi:hypothetical protein